MHKKLKCAHLNVRSLVSHFEYVKNAILLHDIDIMAMTETWLDDSISNNLLHIQGYNIHRVDRLSRGGGVGVYVKTNIKYDVFTTNKHIEQIWMKINVNWVNIAFGVIYNPSRNNYVNFLNDFETTLSTIIPLYDDIICTGDFNIDLLDYNSKFTELMHNTFEGLGLTQIVNQPTRITETSATLLDYVLSSKEELVSVLAVKHIPDVSDHELVIFTVNYKFEVPGVKYVNSRDFKNLNYDRFDADLRSIPWNIIYELDNIDSKIDFLNDTITTLLDIHAPFKTYRLTKPYAPWLTDVIKIMIIDRDRALKKYRITNNPRHWKNYKQLRNMVTVAIKREKKAYYATKLKNKSSKEIWSTLKNILNTNKKDTILPDNINNVDMCNNYFINAVPNLIPDNETIKFYENNLKPNVNSLLTFKLITEIDTLKIIAGIKSKATGADNINILTLHICLPFLAPYITHIINYCLQNSIFPTCWKKAQVIPVPKISNPSSFNDLRPISILPALSKVLEKAIESQVKKHLNKNNIIQPTQSGFRSGHSCTTALLKITDDVIESYDRGKLTILILLDYSKAFDTINHILLKSMLKYIGLSDSALNLLYNYITDRSQAVKYQGNISRFLSVNKGVPQGSILGPLLFSIYTSDFPSTFISCLQHYYADDTQLYMSFNVEESIQAMSALNYDLHNMVTYSKNHCLNLNSAKTTAIMFGKRNIREHFLANYSTSIKISKDILKFSDTIKSLGLWIDKDLRFTYHISRNLQKAYANLKAIYQNRLILDSKTKILLCESLVLSQMNYCDVIYDKCLNNVDINRIQKLQNSCLRLIFGIRKYDHISYTFQHIKWLKMKNRRELHSACCFYKILKTKTPAYLYNKITFRTDVHTLNLRHKNTLTTPMHCTQFFKRSFSYNISKCINNLPFELVSKNSRTFRSQILKLLEYKQLQN